MDDPPQQSFDAYASRFAVSAFYTHLGTGEPRFTNCRSRLTQDISHPMTSLDTHPRRAAATDNLAMHFTWVAQGTAGMRVVADDALTWVDSGLVCDTFNAVCRARLTEENTANAIRTVISHFAEAQRPFSWWVTPGDTPDDLVAQLQDAGLAHAETEIAMAADLTQLFLSLPSATALQIHRVRTSTELRDYARVVAANWFPPDENVLQYYEIAAPLLLASDSLSWLYVGYVGDTAVAASELTVGGGVVGLYNICTLDDYRGRGFGTAMTAQPLRDAQAAGHATAILQAGAMGVNVYARLGFTAFGEVSEYKPSNF